MIEFLPVPELWAGTGILNIMNNVFGKGGVSEWQAKRRDQEL